MADVCGVDAWPATHTVLHDVAIERAFQVGRWGEQNHPDGTGTNWVDQIRPAYGWSGPEAEHAAKLARLDCQRAARRGEGTWMRILREEVAEAFAETDPAKLRAELIQVAAVACAWVEAIDRRAVARDPLCERHGCKHPLSDHVPAAGNVAHPCRACGCPSFSGWAAQQGRASAGEP